MDFVVWALWGYGGLVIVLAIVAWLSRRQRRFVPMQLAPPLEMDFDLMLQQLEDEKEGQ